tara:strand:- start:385 stop:651 length:267 start_codon:yes stop_codon:yes gene_type:complete
MRIRDIVEYSTQDEPAYGTSRAAVRQQGATNANMNRRVNNQNKNANDEANVKAQQQFQAQKRVSKRVATGIPIRAMQPQAPGSPEQQQ